MFTRTRALLLPAAAAAAAFIAAPAAPAGEFCFCMCVTDIPDCVDGGGTIQECIDDWIAFPCDPSGGCCWSVVSPNLSYAGNGVGGAPVVPMPAPGGPIAMAPFKLQKPGGEPVPPSEVASFSAHAVGSSAPLPMFYDPDAGHYVVELIPGPIPPGQQAIIVIIIVLIDGSEVQGAAVAVPECPGDLNLDQKCDSADLNQLLAAFGRSAGGDLDGDGDTDSDDLNILLAAFGDWCIDPV